MKAIVIPQNPGLPLREVEGENYRDLREGTNIKWIERVNTQALHDRGLAMMVDEDGHDRGLGLNLRAMVISGYPGPLVGDAIITGETQSYPIEFISMPEGTMAWAEGQLA